MAGNVVYVRKQSCEELGVVLAYSLVIQVHIMPNPILTICDNCALTGRLKLQELSIGLRECSSDSLVFRNEELLRDKFFQLGSPWKEMLFSEPAALRRLTRESFLTRLLLVISCPDMLRCEWRLIRPLLVIFCAFLIRGLTRPLLVE